MTKVSIIIPFHNVENYIEECLTSVTNQTLQDIEIICVDDGSTDNSRQIVEKIKENDNRIKLLINEEKKGQSVARNKAIEMASGEYIGFVDSDDFIENTMFEKMYFNADITGADITICQANLYDDKTKEFSSNDYYELKNFEKYGNSAFTAEITKNELLDYPAVIWNKIFRTKFLKTINAKFAEGYIYEDLPFCYDTYIKAQKVNIIWEKLYNYRCNREASTMQNADQKVYDRIPMVAKTYDLFQNLSYFDEMNGKFISWVAEDIFHRFTLLEKEYYEPYYYKMKELFESFEINEEEKAVIAKSYCNEELYSIREEDYFGFWKFLIEKYKSTNKQIKEAQHKCNLDIIAIKEFWENENQSIIEKTDAKINENENHFKKQINSLTEEKTLIEEENKTLKLEKEEILTEKEKEINSKIEIILIKDEIIKDKENLVIAKEEEIKEKEEKIQKQKQELEEKDIALSNFSADLHSRDTEILKQKEELENKNVEIKEKLYEIEEKSTKIKEKDEIIEQQQSSLLEKDEILKEKENIILQNESIIEEKNKEIERYTSKIKENEELINNKNTTLFEKESIIQEKDNLLNEKETEICNKQTKIVEIESKIDFLEKKLEEKNIEIVKNSDNSRKREEILINEYNEKLQTQKNILEEQLKVQKDYYENNYLLVKIALAISKTTEELNNIVKKLFKKN